jgi:hypothetical protein
MKLKNIETMQRAIGIIEGVAWVADQKTEDALVAVVEMLDGVIESEEKEDD